MLPFGRHDASLFSSSFFGPDGLDFCIANTAVALLLPGHACFTVLSAPVALSHVSCLAKNYLGFRVALLEVCGVAVQHHVVSNDGSALQAMSGELWQC